MSLEIELLIRMTQRIIPHTLPFSIGHDGSAGRRGTRAADGGAAADEPEPDTAELWLPAGAGVGRGVVRALVVMGRGTGVRKDPRE